MEGWNWFSLEKNYTLIGINGKENEMMVLSDANYLEGNYLTNFKLLLIGMGTYDQNTDNFLQILIPSGYHGNPVSIPTHSNLPFDSASLMHDYVVALMLLLLILRKIQVQVLIISWKSYLWAVTMATK